MDNQLSSNQSPAQDSNNPIMTRLQAIKDAYEAKLAVKRSENIEYLTTLFYGLVSPSSFPSIDTTMANALTSSYQPLINEAIQASNTLFPRTYLFSIHGNIFLSRATLDRIFKGLCQKTFNQAMAYKILHPELIRADWTPTPQPTKRAISTSNRASYTRLYAQQHADAISTRYNRWYSNNKQTILIKKLLRDLNSARSRTPNLRTIQKYNLSQNEDGRWNSSLIAVHG